MGLASPEPGLGGGWVLLYRLVTDRPGLDPLASLQAALGQVQPPGLQQVLPVLFLVTLQGNFMLQEVYDSLISRGCNLKFTILEMLSSFVFEYSSL